MALEPDYGETLLSYEEAEALTPEARKSLGDPIRKADLYDLEQRIQVEVADEWWGSLLNFDVPMRDLLNDHFVRDLHRRLYAPIWEWGGRQRTRETNIGIAPEHITVELRNVLDDLSYQWKHQTRLDARTLGIATHAAVVRIHPFVDGNKRTGFVAADTFLRINGYFLEVDQQLGEESILQLASGQMSKEQLATWFAENLRALNK